MAVSGGSNVFFFFYIKGISHFEVCNPMHIVFWEFTTKGFSAANNVSSKADQKTL